jgi:acyl carrier protein
MLSDTAAVALDARGMAQMAPDLAVGALARALDHDEATLTVVDVDWSRFAPAFAAARPRPLLADLPEARRAIDAIAAAEDRTTTERDLLGTLRGLSEGDRLPHLVTLVVAETAAVLGHTDASRIDPHKGFFDLGLDSLMSLDLRRRLQRATGIKLPATVAFDHPSPHHLAGRLREELLEDVAPPVLAAIAQLESALSAPAANDGEREEVEARLRALLSKWSNGAGMVEPVVEDLRAATDDELFDLIDRNLAGRTVAK